ncbi:caspase family protein [Streptomyces xantholiticus]|uniref:caspase family protein n=1 Tax=Streptomyces xantholiticus TaxID=68285 RepID=UPI0016748EF3|nr:caspase family protein [Streptomyces xantholiticus]GGW50220.1 hypothetical protein GCM10010381_39620 [Streptomyces xantholiticus]
MGTARVQPLVTWPRTVIGGRPFVVSVDLALVDGGQEEWPFEGEEAEFTCIVDGAFHFRVEAVHDASVVLHRFGGSYGPATFMVVPHRTTGRHALRLTSLTSRGIVMGSVELPVEIREAAGVDDSTNPDVEMVGLAARSPVAPPLPRKEALCILMGRYTPGELPDLPDTYEAGERVVDGLVRLGYDCKVLRDPGNADLRFEAVRFFQETHPQTAAHVVYFSGHGVVDPATRELLLPGSDGSMQALADANRFRDWQVCADDSPGGHPTLFLLDTCYSGNAVDLQALDAPDFARNHGTHGRYVVASSAPDEPSYSNVFSRSLADVLEEIAEGRLVADSVGTSISLYTVSERIQQRMLEREPLPQTQRVTTQAVPEPAPPFFPVLPASGGADGAIEEPSAGGGRLRVLGLHGFGNAAMSASAIKAVWLPAIQGGLVRAGARRAVPSIDLTMAYYAHLLMRRVAQGPPPPDDMDDPGGAEEERVLRDWLAASGAPQPRRGLKPNTAVRQAVNWLARSQGMASRPLAAFLTKSIREVRTYFDEDNHAKVSAFVHERIIEDRPDVVLAHSLGAVAAYEALWREPYAKVETLVTFGSALGLVADRLAPHAGNPGRPPGVKRWIDVADASDFVTLPGLQRRFANVESLRIETGGFAAHAARSYLSSPAVAGILVDALARRSHR